MEVCVKSMEEEGRTIFGKIYANILLNKYWIQKALVKHIIVLPKGLSTATVKKRSYRAYVC